MMRFPYLVPGAVWTEEPDGRYLLTLPERGETLRMGRLEHAILGALDGRTPPTEIARNLSMALGKPISEASMAAVLRRLGDQGFLVLPPRSRVEVLPGARLHCCCSGYCCHLWVGPLSALEQKRLSSLPWEELGERPPAGELFFEQDGQTFLRQQDQDNACLFLEPDGRCRVHRVFGFAAKPAICRMFPLFTVDVGEGLLRAGCCYECPGMAEAGPAETLAAEVAQAGELVQATRRQAGVPTLLGAEQMGQLAELTGGATPEGLELERELLAVLAGWGGDAGAALAECARRLLESAGGLLPEGAGLQAFAAELAQLAQGQLDATTSVRYHERLAPIVDFLHALARPAPDVPTPPSSPPPPPLPPELDALLRRAWGNYVFTRYHLFRFGQLAGLSLLIVLHLLFLRLLQQDAAAAEGPDRPAAPQAGPLSRTMDLLRVLEVVSSLRGLGSRTLLELVGLLETTRAVAPKEIPA